MILIEVLFAIAIAKAAQAAPGKDPMVSAIEAAVPAEIVEASDRADAEAREHAAKLRAARAAGPRTTGTLSVHRERRDLVDAAILALSDLDAVFLKEQRMSADPFTNINAIEKSPVAISPDWIVQKQTFCNSVLYMDDPIKALAIEANRITNNDDERYALALLCKAHWTAFVRGANLQ